MREINPELQSRLDGGATTLCRCWRLRRTDGAEFGFTDHDEDLAFDSLLFQASSGLTASALQSGTGLSVDNSQALGALSAAAITEMDIRAGLYDRALVDHWLVDWSSPELRVHMFRARVGEIRRLDGAFELELRGVAEDLNAPIGRSLLRTCDRVLGDAKCQVDLEDPRYSRDGQAAAGSHRSRLIANDLEAFDPHWFVGGTIRWTSGANAGRISAIRSDRSDGDSRILDLWQEPGFAVQAGDRFRAYAGCNKTAETCRMKFDNFLNFRGFPHIPGEDWVTAYPKTGSVHDGSSLRNEG